ncbi:biopolymer transporter ExbD [Agriterribacter sp.]|uniref:ExbD/TolR family protein n=1 Tax=Agriterribacter sp. TaxID=2821509 RepID=UPI002BF13046|nr:biopolymer transporter ExbD [Agriterribacter sp.]HTN06708.1 biopolymer transporter ExbD [Agriterribacter sp.]
MADLNLPVLGKAKYRATGIKALRIDMTPMVDLGFLLITFFIFNTVLNRHTAMQLLLPADGPSAPFAESRTLTVLLAQDGNAICYEGFAQEPSGIHAINMFLAPAALRSIITQKQKSLGNQAALMVIIKPGTQSNYRQLVAALDEMTISGVKKYAITDVDQADKKLLLATP